MTWASFRGSATSAWPSCSTRYRTETRSGVPIGSPDYMAPEQAAGRLREHGPATDVYALGVILYELLTGRPPHRGETDLETLRLVADQDPPSPRALRPGLPRDLETIALKCLEKQSSRRYAFASELVADLQRFLDGRPVKARPVPVWERAAKWAKRRPLHAMVLIMLALSVPAVLAGLKWIRDADAALRLAWESSSRSESEARKQRADFERERLNARRHEAAVQLKEAGTLVGAEEISAARAIIEGLEPLGVPPDSRGFAWRYLDRLVHPRTELLPKLPDRVRGVACSPDGRTIALTCYVDGSTFLLDRTTQTVRRLAGKSNGVWCPRMLFSPDGRTIAALIRARPSKTRHCARSRCGMSQPVPRSMEWPSNSACVTRSFSARKARIW